MVLILIPELQDGVPGCLRKGDELSGMHRQFVNASRQNEIVQ